MAVTGYRIFTGAPAFSGNWLKLEMSPVLDPVLPSAPAQPPRDEKMWQAAQGLEAVFLEEMLKTAGLGRTPEAFGGGAGEDQFASFLIREQATALVEAGGVGLAEMLYQSLLERNP